MTRGRPEQRIKTELRREQQRVHAAKAREASRAACRHTNRLKTKDSGTSQAKCRVCEERIRFTTVNGELVALDWGLLRPHRHGISS